MGLGAALVVGDVWWDGGWKGASEEARACGRAVPYHSGTTGPMKAVATHGTPWSFPYQGRREVSGLRSEYSTGVHIGSRGVGSRVGGGRGGRREGEKGSDGRCAFRRDGFTALAHLRPAGNDGGDGGGERREEGGRRKGSATGGVPSGGMDSRLGASATCLRRNDGGRG